MRRIILTTCEILWLLFGAFLIGSDDVHGQTTKSNVTLAGSTLPLSRFDELFNRDIEWEAPVRVIYPSDSSLKPLGCAGASTSDWAASAFLTTKINIRTEGFDTDAFFVNQTSGKPSGYKGLVSLGGPLVNIPVCYYELHKIAPVLYAYIPGAAGPDQPRSLWCYANGTSIAATAVGIDEHNDFFLIELFRDNDGRAVLLGYGISGKGTYAAGKYFHYTVYPNLTSYDVSWIIVKWEDTNGTGFVNAPYDGDTYSLIASGQ